MRRSTKQQTRVTRVLALAVGVILWSACSDASETGSTFMPGPEAGTLAVTLSTQAPDVGAVSFSLTGSGILNVRPAHDGIEVFSLEGSGGWQVAAIGVGLGGDVVHFAVHDLGEADLYVVELLELSDEDNELIRELGGHRLGVEVRR